MPKPPMPEPDVLTFDAALQSPLPSYTLTKLAARDAQWEQIVREAVAQERERLARLCDVQLDDGSYDEWVSGYNCGIEVCAKTIRAQTDNQ